MQFAAFTKTQTALRLTSGGQRSFRFPRLEVYDNAGRLVYTGYDPGRNAEVLQSLPKNIPILSPSGAASSLATTVEEIPEFRLNKLKLLGKGKVSVLAISLDECSGCSYQDGILQNVSSRLTQADINVLTLHVISR